MFLVVGYKRHPSSASYPTVLVYGLFDTIQAAISHQVHLTGRTEPQFEGTALRVGRGYTTWIKLLERNAPTAMTLNGGMDALPVQIQHTRIVTWESRPESPVMSSSVPLPATESVMYEPRKHRIVWTDAPEDADVILCANVTQKVEGFYVAIDPATQAAPTSYRPGRDLVQFRTHLQQGDVVLFDSKKSIAECTGSIVLRPRTEQARVVDEATAKSSASGSAAPVPVSSGGKRAPSRASSGISKVRRSIPKKNTNIVVEGRGAVKRSMLQRVLLTCFQALNIQTKYMIHTQPCGLAKIAVKNDSGIRVFTTISDCLEHVKANVLVDIETELSTNPSRLFQCVLDLPDEVFTAAQRG